MVNKVLLDTPVLLAKKVNEVKKDLLAVRA